LIDPFTACYQAKTSPKPEAARGIRGFANCFRRGASAAMRSSTARLGNLSDNLVFAFRGVRLRPQRIDCQSSARRPSFGATFVTLACYIGVWSHSMTFLSFVAVCILHVWFTVPH